MTIKNYIETAEDFIKNFKGTRDSEFSEYEELDLTKLREARHAEIVAIRDKNTNIDIYRVNRKKRGARKDFAIKYGEPDRDGYGNIVNK